MVSHEAWKSFEKDFVWYYIINSILSNAVSTYIKYFGKRNFLFSIYIPVLALLYLYNITSKHSLNLEKYKKLKDYICRFNRC